RGTEPGIERLQRVDEPYVEGPPEPLRRVTPVVPERRQHAAETSGVVDQVLAACPGVGLTKVEPVGIEERSILDVQRKLEKMLRAGRTERLGGAAAISDRLVVADAGIVRVTCLLQRAKGLLVAEQPVHPDADRGLAGHRGESLQLGAPLLRAVPGI